MTPKCAEAELLSHLDMIDSRMEIYRIADAETPPGTFSRQKVYGLNNSAIYHPSEQSQKDSE